MSQFVVPAHDQPTARVCSLSPDKNDGWSVGLVAIVTTYLLFKNKQTLKRKSWKSWVAMSNYSSLHVTSYYCNTSSAIMAQAPLWVEPVVGDARFFRPQGWRQGTRIPMDPRQTIGGNRHFEWGMLWFMDQMLKNPNFEHQKPRS